MWKLVDALGRSVISLVPGGVRYADSNSLPDSGEVIPAGRLPRALDRFTVTPHQGHKKAWAWSESGHCRSDYRTYRWQRSCGKQRRQHHDCSFEKAAGRHLAVRLDDEDAGRETGRRTTGANPISKDAVQSATACASGLIDPTFWMHTTSGKLTPSTRGRRKSQVVHTPALRRGRQAGWPGQEDWSHQPVGPA